MGQNCLLRLHSLEQKSATKKKLYVSGQKIWLNKQIKFDKKLPFIQDRRLILKSPPFLFRLGKGKVHFFIVKNALFEVWLFCKVSKNAQ